MNTNQSWNHGANTAKSGQGPSNYANKPTPIRQSYVAGYNSAKPSQNTTKK